MQHDINTKNYYIIKSVNCKVHILILRTNNNFVGGMHSIFGAISRKHCVLQVNLTNHEISHLRDSPTSLLLHHYRFQKLIPPDTTLAPTLNLVILSIGLHNNCRLCSQLDRVETN